MTIENLVKQVIEDFYDACGQDYEKCKYSIAASCGVWYAFDNLENNGYFRNKEDRDLICNYYYKNNVNKDTLVEPAMRGFIRWLDVCGYLKGVEE